MTYLNNQKNEDNETSCLPWPPMLQPQLGDYSTILLRKAHLYSSTTLLSYQEFKKEPSHKKGYP